MSTIGIVSIKVEVLCRCGAPLGARINRHNNEITVDPCEGCMFDEYKRGKQEGLVCVCKEK